MDEQDPEERPELAPAEQDGESTAQSPASEVDSSRDVESVEAADAAPAVEQELVEESSEVPSAAAPGPMEPAPNEPAPIEPALMQADEQPTEAEHELVPENVAEAAVAVSRPASSVGYGSRGGRLPLSEVAPEASTEAAWYVIHCYSGYENKVRHNLEQRIETMGMKDRIFDVVIPTQEEVEVREGKRRTVERHIFPGYVLVNMSLSEESWYVVRNTPGVTGFVGMGNLPTALRPEEVSQIIKRMEADAPVVKVSYKVGERVRIVDGPFNDFRGTVADIDMERTKVRVLVSFFGRETPVELDFLQVEKA
jgi:transcriptional antiterminator NusG